MANLKCQNPECGKSFKGRRQKGYVSKFCSNQCSADDRKNRPELYDTKKLGFQKGHKSWNKGKKGEKTGSFMIRSKTMKTGNVKRLRFINVGIGEDGVVKYVRNDRHVWEQKNGPLPKEHVIYHKDGRTLNDDLDNLECITTGEALSRYASLRESVYDIKNENDVKKIIKGCLVNDRKIQKMIFEMTYERMMGVIMRYASDNDSAQDILSDSWIKIFNKMGDYENKGAFEGWITRIAINTALDSLRKSKNTFVMDTNDMSYFDEMSSEDEEFELKDLEGVSSTEILSEIQNLPTSYRTVFNLFVFEGMGHKEIAAELGIAEGTSKSNLSKARVILKDRVTKLIAKNKRKREVLIEGYREYDMEMN
jgi:RNA polymerase sigma-70 factor (ECF subfamily)